MRVTFNWLSFKRLIVASGLKIQILLVLGSPVGQGSREYILFFVFVV